MKRILITGGTGFLGSNLTRNLVKKGFQVTVFDNDYRGKQARLKDIEKDFEFIKGDIRNLSQVAKALNKKDIVIHLAYINGTEFFYSKPELVLEVAVKGMMNILDASIKNNVCEFFYASSSEVYNYPSKIPTDETAAFLVPDPKNPRFSYSGGKIIGELLALNYGRKFFKRTVIFRPHNVYGPDMGNEHAIPQIINRMNKLKSKNKIGFIFPIQGTGKETRAYVYIDDFIKGLEIIIEKGKDLEIYNIGTEEEVSVINLTNEISKILGCSVKIKSGKLLPGSTTRRVPDISKLKKLGYKPTINLSTGLENTVSWYIDKKI